MTLLRCATHVVQDLNAALERYSRVFGYVVVERGETSVDLARAWQAPASTGSAYAVVQPASGFPVFLRFIEGAPHPDYQPLRSYGWIATEICVQDVEKVNSIMLEAKSEFEIIGSPHVLDGFPTVKPMQVKGVADGEIIYLTEVVVDDPANGLPSPASLLDHPFIMVHACHDLKGSLQWVMDVLGLPINGPVAIYNALLDNVYEIQEKTRHELATAMGKGKTFLELDQLPSGATTRLRHPGALPPGVAIVTITFPDFDRLSSHWVTEPAVRQGKIYGGRRVGILKTPDGALLEVVEDPE